LERFEGGRRRPRARLPKLHIEPSNNSRVLELSRALPNPCSQRNELNNPGTSGADSSMLQFAIGFVITPRRRGGRSEPKTRWNQKWAAGPHKSKTTQRSKRQVCKSDPSELRWEHPQVKAQAEGGGAGKTTRAKARHRKNA